MDKHKWDDFIPPWNSHNYEDNETLQEYNKRKTEELISFGWNKPIEYDENGYMIWPNIDKLQEVINDNMFDKRDPYEIAEINNCTFVPIEELDLNKYGGVSKSKIKKIKKNNKK
jgi:hypothetical protein